MPKNSNRSPRYLLACPCIARRCRLSSASSRHELVLPQPLIGGERSQRDRTGKIAHFHACAGDRPPSIVEPRRSNVDAAAPGRRTALRSPGPGSNRFHSSFCRATAAETPNRSLSGIRPNGGKARKVSRCCTPDENAERRDCAPPAGFPPLKLANLLTVSNLGFSLAYAPNDLPRGLCVPEGNP